MDNLKFIHTADLHLDSALSSLDGNKARIRRGELMDSFARLAAYAFKEGVFGVIVAGDMFDTRFASITAKRQAADIMRANPVRFFLLSGNHDQKAFDRDFEEMLPQNVTVLRQGEVCSFDGVNVAGFYGGEVAEMPQSGFNIAVMHGQIGADIDLRAIAGKNIDYLALGHLHSFSQGKVDSRCRYAYCGCLEGRGFDECGEKGFVLFDTTGMMKFMPFSTRQCREIKVDVTGADSYVSQLEKVNEKIKDLPKGDIFKIILTGKLQEGVKADVAHVCDRLNGDLFFAKVCDETGVMLDENKLKRENSLRGEFFRVVAAAGLSDEDKERVLKIGFAAIDGSEVEE